MWFGNPKPAMEKGSADNPYSGSTGLRGTPKLDQGFEFAVPPTGHDVIRVTYFASQAAGGSYIPGAVQVWNEFYPANTFLDTNFRLKSLKISYEYLTWPYPVKASKFRLKTLWEFQYTSLHTGFDAPLAPVTDSLGNFITDSNGNVVGYNTQGTVHFMLPSVGVSITASQTRSSRPHRS